MTDLKTMEREILEKAIRGALKCFVDAHGPMTADLIPSAAKRVAGQLSAEIGRFDNTLQSKE